MKLNVDVSGWTEQFHDDTHLCVDLHVKHSRYHESELKMGCEIALEEIASELQQFRASIYDHYLDLDRSEVIIDIEPLSAYSLIVLKDHWLKDHIRRS